VNPNAHSTECEGHLFGKSGQHARVIVMTVTDDERSVARNVFGECCALKEVDGLAVYTSARFTNEGSLPFVLAQAGDRGNLGLSSDIEQWMRQFQPQVFLLVGSKRSPAAG
jgi:hypothetical protein